MIAALPLFLARYWKPMAIICAVFALVWGYFAWQDHQRDLGARQERALWEVKIADQKKLAADKLKEEQDKTADVERKLANARDIQQTKDSANAKTITDLSAELGRVKRLRDPYAKPGCGSSSGGATGSSAASASAGADTGAEASGLLSEGLSDLLRTMTREADEINIAYQSCRADAFKLRELLK